jgi:hypothetical protein
MILGCEQGNAQRTETNGSYLELAFLIIKCTMEPHFASLCEQSNFERYTSSIWQQCVLSADITCF